MRESPSSCPPLTVPQTYDELKEMLDRIMYTTLYSDAKRKLSQDPAMQNVFGLLHRHRHDHVGSDRLTPEDRGLCTDLLHQSGIPVDGWITWIRGRIEKVFGK